MPKQKKEESASADSAPESGSAPEEKPPAKKGSSKDLKKKDSSKEVKKGSSKDEKKEEEPKEEPKAESKKGKAEKKDSGKGAGKKGKKEDLGAKNKIGTLFLKDLGKAAEPTKCKVCGGKKATWQVSPALGEHAQEMWCKKCADDALEGEVVSMSKGKTKGTPKFSILNYNTWGFTAIHNAGKNPLPGNWMTLANRQMIFRLFPEDEEPFLLMINFNFVDQAAKQPLQAIKDLEKRTGCKLQYVLSPCDGHHMAGVHYVREFPDAKFIMPDGRMCRAQTFEADPMFKVDEPYENVSVYDPYADGQELPELAALGLHVHTLIGIKEQQQPMGEISKYGRDTTEHCFFYHDETQALVNGGHTFWFSPTGDKSMGSLIKKAVPCDFQKATKERPVQVANFFDQKKINPKAHVVYDLDLLRGRAQAVLAHRPALLMDLHCGPNQAVLTGAGTHDFVESLFKNVLDDKLAKTKLSIQKLERWTGYPVGKEGQGKQKIGMYSASKDRVDNSWKKGKGKSGKSEKAESKPAAEESAEEESKGASKKGDKKAAPEKKAAPAKKGSGKDLKKEGSGKDLKKDDKKAEPKGDDKKVKTDKDASSDDSSSSESEKSDDKKKSKKSESKKE